ncbi:CaiB/BaiF CoA transferase family protein [Rummeliibacillus sp. JY-2-4R]
MLEGIRIIDFSQYLPGPHASLRLVDMGAEVIKVESPQGDPSRPATDEKGEGLVFLTQNRNKKSIVLNLKDPNDQQTALNLIYNADVVLEGFRPGVMNRLGIGYEEIIKVKKDIIYCSLTGYGQTGKMSSMGGHDINYLSLSGVLSQLKDSNGRPVQPSTTLADFVGGIAASEAILGALVKKLRTGVGSYIDLSITDALLSLMSNHSVIESVTGEENGVSKLHNKHVCYFLYETKDGRYVSLGALEFKFWQNFCTALNKENWLNEQFSLVALENPIFEEMKQMFASKTLAEWTKFSEEVDCCIAPVLETSELHSLQLFRDRGLIVEKEGIRHISTKYSPVITISNQTTAPRLGQHFEEIRNEYEIKK